MSELRSAVEALETEDLGGLADAALEEDFAELQRTIERLEVQRLRRLAELDRRRPWLTDGLLSTSSWLVRQFRGSFSSAASDVRMARALDSMPGTRNALTAGEIPASAARVLVAARETDWEEFASSEGMLVDAATRHTVRDLQRVVDYWREAVSSKRPVGPGEEDPLRRLRRLHVSPTVFGMVRIDGDLDPETGETVMTALRTCVDATPRDGRTPAQRRADGLDEVCRGWLDSADRPQIGGERPHVTLTVGLETLRGRSDGSRELARTGPVSIEAARRLACDATVSRVLTMGCSEPLDVGRRTPVVPGPMRRAVIVRDRHCRFLGCDRPPPWCDAHHVRHLGRRWIHRDFEPGPAVPAPPSARARPRRDQPADARGPPNLHATGGQPPRRTSPAVAASR
jgi:hypothetical protein